MLTVTWVTDKRRAPPGLQRRGPREGGSPVQVPAPFDYVRATSVADVLELLERHGPESRRHRRRAQPAADDEAPAGPARVADRHQRPHRAAAHHRGRRLAAGRRPDPARRPARVRRRRAAVPDDPRRGEGHRRPRRAQPRHDRRLPRAGRPGRGPHHRVRRAPGPGVHRRPRRRADGRHPPVPPRAVRDRLRAARAAHRDPVPDPAAASGQRLREGRAAGRGLGGRRRRRRASGWPRTARSPTPRSASPPSGWRGWPPTPAAVAHRRAAQRGPLRRGGRPGRARPARRSRTSAARSTTSATSPTSSPGGRSRRALDRAAHPTAVQGG